MIRVLHVVTSMNRGGLEVWLMHVLRTMDRDRFRFDFVVQSPHEGVFDREIRALGSRVIVCPRGSNPVRFAASFLRALRTCGPYDVVHTHVHHFSGVVALVARLGGVSRIVAHSHSVAYGQRPRLGRVTRLYLSATEALMRRFVSVGLACSQDAGVDLFQGDWTGPAHRVLHCGLDFSPFQRPVGGAAAVAAGPRPRTLIHVGRFSRPKNHEFLIEVIDALRKRRDDFRVLLIGTGPLQNGVRDEVRRRGLGHVVEFCGDRNDVPALLSQSDLFLFPSRIEGLGLALVEAQAAGLRCLVSEGVPAEAIVLPEAVSRVDLGSGAEAWAREADALLSAVRLEPAAALSRLRASTFNITNSVAALFGVYRELVAAGR